MIRLALVLALAGSLSAAEPTAVDLKFEDQFEKVRQTADHRGAVLVIVYSDRKGVDESRRLGEQLHVAFHPAAKGLTGGKARQQPVAALPGLPAGKTSPEVVVQAVACCGKIPGPVRGLLRLQLQAASAEVPVWLDFEETMVTKFGLMTGQPNVAVFDTQGRYRHLVNGTPDEKKRATVESWIGDLRAEGVR